MEKLIRLETPLNDDLCESLSAGDRVLLSGVFIPAGMPPIADFVKRPCVVNPCRFRCRVRLFFTPDRHRQDREP